MAQRRKTRWFIWPLVWLIHLALYLLYVAQINTQELCFGCGAAAVATIAMAVFQSVGIVEFFPTPKYLLEAWRIPWYMVEGTWEILQAQATQIFTRDGAQSILFAVGFEIGGEDPRSCARRALAVTYTTMTPNFVVVGLDNRNELMLYHQIKKGPVLQMTKNLGAQP